jgi:hypothetical protein
MAHLATFIADLVRLCSRQQLTLIDHWRLSVVDLMPDNLHIGKSTKRHMADQLAAAIAESECVYNHPMQRASATG